MSLFAEGGVCEQTIKWILCLYVWVEFFFCLNQFQAFIYPCKPTEYQYNQVLWCGTKQILTSFEIKRTFIAKETKVGIDEMTGYSTDISRFWQKRKKVGGKKVFTIVWTCFELFCKDFFTSVAFTLTFARETIRLGISLLASGDLRNGNVHTLA